MTAHRGDPAPASSTILDTIVIGAGQAGLSIAWHLRRQQRRFLVLDAAPQIGHTWRSRWDTLTLFTSARYDALPGMPFPGRPDSYPTKDAVADYLRDYVRAFNLPVRAGARVIELTRAGEVFRVRTADQTFHAHQVVVATGPFQEPYIPPLAHRLAPAVAQLHSAAYRNPRDLPDGPVLVVGGGNSGFQIAAQLAATRRVDLSIGTKAVTLPQRLLGRDLFWWLTRLGLMGATADSRLGQRMQRQPDTVIGVGRRGLRRAGVTLRPRLIDADATSVRFADGATLDVGTVIWATGYRPDHRWIHIPGVLADGGVIHRRGVTDVAGLYFLGLPWQHTRGSALLGFVHHDAAHLAAHLAGLLAAAPHACRTPALTADRG